MSSRWVLGSCADVSEVLYRFGSSGSDQNACLFVQAEQQAGVSKSGAENLKSNQ